MRNRIIYLTIINSSFMINASIIPTHLVAQWLLTHIHNMLDNIGLEKDKGTEDIIYLAIIVVIALLTSSLRHPKRQDGQTGASATDVPGSASSCE